MKHGTYIGDKFNVHSRPLKGQRALLMINGRTLKAQFDEVATGYGHAGMNSQSRNGRSTMKNDALGNRIKTNYEQPARHFLTRRVPVIVRVDGRAFHTLTARHFQRPFDGKFIDAMIVAANHLAVEMQGFKLGYVQSDEASFVLTDYDNLQTQPWFGYCQNKIESISAATMTFAFARCLRLAGVNTDAVFDARAFNVPESEVANYFLWRAKDWYRNSVCMFARSVFSHSQMHGESVRDLHEMLHANGRNWATDLMDAEKNGTFILGDHTTRDDIEPHFPEIDALWSNWNPTTREEQCPGNENDASPCQMDSPSTSNGQAGNENDSALSAASSGPAAKENGSLGSGIIQRSNVTRR